MNNSLGNITGATGLTEEDRDRLERLVNVWQAKLARNRLCKRYYEGRRTAAEVNLGIAIPEELSALEVSCCWGAKAVDVLAARSKFDSYVFSDGETVTELEGLVRDNQLVLRYQKAVVSELIHSVVFATVSRGGEGEPKAMVHFHSAESAAGIWSGRKDRLDCGFAIIDSRVFDKGAEEMPCLVALHTDTHVVEIERGDDLEWHAEYLPHSMGRPMMEPLMYRPSELRPFGRSRITRSVMTLVDCALRETMRAEIAAEFNVSPQKYMLGASDEDFEKSRWEAYIGHWLLVGRDENGDVPQVGQFSPGTMAYHEAYMRDLAAQFSAATSVPMSSLGVANSNPYSSEAIHAMSEDLVIEAESLELSNGRGLYNIGLMMLAISENVPLSEIPEEERDFMPHFADPAHPSVVSQAAAMIQTASAAPWFAGTEVFFEELGFDAATRARIMSDKRRAEAQALIQQQQIEAAEAQAHQKQATMYEISSIIKAYRSERISRNDALVLFAQVGIGTEQAAHILDDAEDAAETIAAVSGAAGTVGGEAIDAIGG